jgi:hypothetical protein
MEFDSAKELLKTHLRNLVRGNYDEHFELWIEDAWHAGLPTLYVDVLFGTLDKHRTLKTRIGEDSVRDLQRKVEIMGEHVSHATLAFISVVPNHTETLVFSFISKLVDTQFNDNELSMFLEELTDEDEPTTT